MRILATLLLLAHAMAPVLRAQEEARPGPQAPQAPQVRQIEAAAEPEAASGSVTDPTAAPMPLLPPPSPLLQPSRPPLFEPPSSEPLPPPEAGEPIPDIEAQFENFPVLDEKELLSPGRLVTAAQRRVQLRKARSVAESDAGVQAARFNAAESLTFAGRREWLTEYYRLLAARMRKQSPTLRPEIDRLEIDSIKALNDLPTDPNDTLDAYLPPR